MYWFILTACSLLRWMMRRSSNSSSLNDIIISLSRDRLQRMKNLFTYLVNSFSSGRQQQQWICTFVPIYFKNYKYIIFIIFVWICVWENSFGWKKGHCWDKTVKESNFCFSITLRWNNGVSIPLQALKELKEIPRHFKNPLCYIPSYIQFTTFSTQIKGFVLQSSLIGNK